MRLFLIILLLLVGFFLHFFLKKHDTDKMLVFVPNLLYLSAILILLSSFVKIIPAGNVGVVEFFGSVASKPLSNGLHLVNPLAKVTELSVKTQQAQEFIETPSSEGLNITLDVSLLFRLDSVKVPELYRTSVWIFAGRFSCPVFVPRSGV